MSATPVPTRRMTASEFLAWADAQPDCRCELVDGHVIAMAPDRVRHNLTKLAIAVALQEAVATAKLPCTVFTDGVGIRITDETIRLPDASVQCGIKPKPDQMILDEPIIIVEVASPSSERIDFGAKLIEYFSLSSIGHYLVVVPEKRAVVHHTRNEDGGLSTYIGRTGDIVLNPPGLRVSVAALLGPRFDEDVERGG